MSVRNFLYSGRMMGCEFVVYIYGITTSISIAVVERGREGGRGREAERENREREREKAKGGKERESIHEITFFCDVFCG